MGFLIKNITYLLDKKNFNHNKVLTFKVKLNQKFVEYKIVPYQEVIYNSNLLTTELKKMELLGMIQCIPISSNFIESYSNSKKEVASKKEEEDHLDKNKQKKRNKIDN